MKSDEIINFKDEVISDWLMVHKLWKVKSFLEKIVCCQNIGIQNFGIIDSVLLRFSIGISDESSVSVFKLCPCRPVSA